MKTIDDCLVIGAGVVGLSIAYELAGRGLKVRIIDRGQPGREASWAGAGILPAAKFRPNDSAYDKLCGLSAELYPSLSQQLREETGIDNEYSACGELYVTRTAELNGWLDAEIEKWKRRGIHFGEVTNRIGDFLPARGSQRDNKFERAVFLSESAQLRNPRHLKALITACQARGVEFSTDERETECETRGNRVVSVQASGGRFEAKNFCVAAGAWSSDVLAPLGIRIAIKPMRGQMALLRLREPIFSTVIHEGLLYLVPRRDGRVLVGSTIEDVGFDRRTTADGIRPLLAFASSMIPALAEAEVERCWAGLRPGSPEGQPYIGRAANFENLFVAAGHFRWGLYLSPATALLMAQLICDEKPQIDIEPFRVDRN